MCKVIYKDIYENVIKVGVEAIENVNYKLAYTIYKENILNLEEEFARPALEIRIIWALRNRLVSAN